VWVCPLTAGNACQPSAPPALVMRFTLGIRHLTWHPTKPLLGIGTDDGKLTVYAPNEEQSKRRKEFKVWSSDGGVRCLAFDPRGEVLAAAVSSGALVIFRMQDAADLHRATVWPKATIGEERLQIAWQPDGEALALTGSPSVRVVLRGAYAPVCELKGGHRLSTTAIAWSSCGTLLASASSDAVAIWGNQRLLKVFHLDAEPLSIIWKGDKGVACGTVAGSFAYLLAPSLEDTAGDSAVSEEAPVAVSAEGEDPAEIAEGTVQAQEVQPKLSGEMQPSLAAIVQMPLQPGATSSRRGRRYLAWSDHGTLKFHPPPAGSASAGILEVEYSQRAAAGRGCRELQAPARTTLGAIGPGVCAVATEAPSVVAWMSEQRFEHQIPSGERIASLAVGTQFVAALTSPEALLHITSIAGVPIAVLALSGEPVCLAARDDMLLVVTRAPGTSCEPSLEYVLYGVAARERLSVGRVPLSRGATLRWVGLSSESLPLALDSCGQLRALALAGGTNPALTSAGWVPVAEVGARLWPVRAGGGALYCVAVDKDGGEPPVGPMRKLHEVRYRIPIQTEVEGAQGPELLLRQDFLSAHMGFMLVSDLLPTPVRTTTRKDYEKRNSGRQALRLFELLAKSGEVEQALDVVEAYLLPLPEHPDQSIHPVEEARAAAVKLGREALASKIGALRPEANDQPVPPTAPDEEHRSNTQGEESIGQEGSAVEAEAASVGGVTPEQAALTKEQREDPLQRVAAKCGQEGTAVEADAASIGDLTPEQAALIKERREEALRRAAAKRGQEGIAEENESASIGGVTLEQAALIKERREEALRRAAAKRAAVAEGCPAAVRQRVE